MRHSIPRLITPCIIGLAFALSGCAPQSGDGLDGDEDGRVVPFDNCPDTANADQRDSNLNGIGDACEPGPKLRLQITGEGSVTVAPPGGAIFTRNTPTVISVTSMIPTTLVAFSSEPGWIFDHWEGDVTGESNPAFLTVATEAQVTAAFVQDPTWTGSGDGGGAQFMRDQCGIWQGTLTTNRTRTKSKVTTCGLGGEDSESRDETLTSTIQVTLSELVIPGTGIVSSASGQVQYSRTEKMKSVALCTVDESTSEVSYSYGAEPGNLRIVFILGAQDFLSGVAGQDLFFFDVAVSIFPPNYDPTDGVTKSKHTVCDSPSEPIPDKTWKEFPAAINAKMQGSYHRKPDGLDVIEAGTVETEPPPPTDCSSGDCTCRASDVVVHTHKLKLTRVPVPGCNE